MKLQRPRPSWCGRRALWGSILALGLSPCPALPVLLLLLLPPTLAETLRSCRDRAFLHTVSVRRHGLGDGAWRSSTERGAATRETGPPQDFAIPTRLYEGGGRVLSRHPDRFAGRTVYPKEPSMTMSDSSEHAMDAASTATAGAAVPNKRRPHRARRIVVRTLVSVLAVVLLVVAAGGIFGSWTVSRSFPQATGTIEAAGLDAEVSVTRDEFGVPTIVADNAHDLFYAQGFVQAQDRFWEMDMRRHITAGRVSEFFGESQLGTDKFLRTLGWRKVAEQEVAALDPVALSYYEAYAEGVNAWMADRRGADLSLEYAVLDLTNPGYVPEPWVPADSVAWLKAMAWDLRSNIETETERALLAQTLDAATIAELYPGYPWDANPVIMPASAPLPTAAASGTAPASAATASMSAPLREAREIVAEAAALFDGVGEGVGSNSWVVAGSKTESGLPLLANDPHLGAALPSVWHQIGLRCAVKSPDCAFDVSGFSFAGLPGVVIGHNDRIAWGFTNLTTDVADLYIEKTDGDNSWVDGALVPMDVRKETVRVAGGDDVTLTIRSTGHGPIISGLTPDFTSIADDPGLAVDGEVDPSRVAGSPIAEPPGEYAVSIRWTALDAGTTAGAIFAINAATSWDEFRGAAALFDVPAQNLVYADVDGNIGYQAPGRLPIRGAGDGSVPQPGWDSAYNWTGFIPFDDLPRSFDPDEGFLVTANNAIVRTTFDTAADGTSGAYPYFLTNDWDYGYRADRITELLTAKMAAGPLNAQDLSDIQGDNLMWIATRLLPELTALKTEGTTAEAIALLENWDLQATARSGAAAFANVFWRNLVTEMFAKKHPEIPLSDQDRWFTVVNTLLDDPASPWWTNESAGISGKSEMIAHAAELATTELVGLQGNDVSRWNWGDLHALSLRNGTFGESGIAPIEAIFNRGPYKTGGGSSLVNATGWSLDEGYATATVPSMRMVIDLADFDASTWNHLTGNSGHAFHPNYVDQTPIWQVAGHQPWSFSPDAVQAAARETLRLVPAP